MKQSTPINKKGQIHVFFCKTDFTVFSAFHKQSPQHNRRSINDPSPTHTQRHVSLPGQLLAVCKLLFRLKSRRLEQPLFELFLTLSVIAIAIGIFAGSRQLVLARPRRSGAVTRHDAIDDFDALQIGRTRIRDAPVVEIPPECLQFLPPSGAPSQQQLRVEKATVLDYSPVHEADRIVRPIDKLLVSPSTDACRQLLRRVLHMLNFYIRKGTRPDVVFYENAARAERGFYSLNSVESTGDSGEFCRMRRGKSSAGVFR